MNCCQRMAIYRLRYGEDVWRYTRFASRRIAIRCLCWSVAHQSLVFLRVYAFERSKQPNYLSSYSLVIVDDSIIYYDDSFIHYAFLLHVKYISVCN